MSVGLVTEFLQDLPVILDKMDHPVSIADVEEHLDRGDLIPWLKQLVPQLASSLSYLQEGQMQFLHKELQNAATAYGARRSGIERCGLCYVMSLLVLVLRVLPGYEAFNDANVDPGHR